MAVANDPFAEKASAVESGEALDYAALNAKIERLAALRKESNRLEKECKALTDEVRPVIEKLGSAYTTSNGFTAFISHSTYWDVNVAKLIKKFGEKVYAYLAIDARRFRMAVESRSLPISQLKGIAVMGRGAARLEIKKPDEVTAEDPKRCVE